MPRDWSLLNFILAWYNFTVNCNTSTTTIIIASTDNFSPLPKSPSLIGSRKGDMVAISWEEVRASIFKKREASMRNLQRVTVDGVIKTGEIWDYISCSFWFRTKAVQWVCISSVDGITKWQRSMQEPASPRMIFIGTCPWSVSRYASGVLSCRASLA